MEASDNSYALQILKIYTIGNILIPYPYTSSKTFTYR